MSFPKPRYLDRAIVLSIGPALFEAARLLGVGDYVAQLPITILQYLKHSTYEEKRIILAHGFRGTTPCSDGPRALGLWPGTSMRWSLSTDRAASRVFSLLLKSFVFWYPFHPSPDSLATSIFSCHHSFAFSSKPHSHGVESLPLPLSWVCLSFLHVLPFRAWYFVPSQLWTLFHCVAYLSSQLGKSILFAFNFSSSLAIMNKAIINILV